MFGSSLFSNAPTGLPAANPVKSSRSVSSRTRRMSQSLEHKQLLNAYKPPPVLEQSDSEDIIIPTKLIYKKDKLFWQIQGTIEFHIFEHVDSEPCRLEVVPIEKVSGNELEHIYLSMELILPRVASEIQRRVDEKLKSLKAVRQKSSKSGSGKGVPQLTASFGSSSFSQSDMVIREDITNEVIGEYILSRTIAIPPDGQSTDPLQVRIKQTSSEMADPTKLSIVMLKPSGKSDLSISRPRRPSFAEFDSILQSFNTDAKSLHHASSSAELFSDKSTEAFVKLEDLKKTRVRSMSIDELKELEVKAKRIPTPEMLTPKERWLRTIQSIHSRKTEPEEEQTRAAPTRGRRETFPNSFSPTPPERTPRTFSPGLRNTSRDKSGSPGAPRWNGGTRASPLKSPVISQFSTPSKADCKPPRPVWSSSPSKAAGGALSTSIVISKRQ